MQPSRKDTLAGIKALWARLNASPTTARKKSYAPNWVAIQWEEKGATVVDAEITGSVEVRRIVNVTWPALGDPETSPSQAGAALKRELASHSISTTQAVVVVSRDDAVVRRIELPAVPDEELPDLVRFQAAARTSTPLDRLALDYVPLVASDENLRSVLLVTIDAARLKSIRETLAAAGLQLEAVTLSPLATAELVNRSASESDRSAPSIVIWQKGEYVELSLLDQARLSFSHSIRLPAAEGDAHIQPLQTELNRTLIAMGQSHPGAELTQAYLIPGRNADPQVRDLLRKRFSHGLQLLEPLDSVEASGLSVEERAAASVAAPAIGELLARHRATLPAIDFVNPRKKVQPPDRRKERTRLFAGGGVLLVALGLWWQQSTLAELQAEVDQLDGEIASFDQSIIEGQPAMKEAKALRDWQASHASAIPTIAKLKQYLPDTGRLYFTNIKVASGTADTVARITGEFRAKTASDINDLFDRLPKSEFRVIPRVPGNEKRDPDYPVELKFEIDELKPSPKKPVPAAASAG
jgi:Tfp pilus assembly PilM family ATPase